MSSWSLHIWKTCYNQGKVMFLTLFINLKLCLIQFLLLSCSCKDLKKMFCNNIITNPIPNSTADKTRKKNVNDKRLILSYKKPIDSTMIYKVIHSNSAVSNRCNALDTLFAILKINIKNKIKYKLMSPINIKYNFIIRIHNT